MRAIRCRPGEENPAGPVLILKPFAVFREIALFILFFYAPSAKLVVELDGAQHLEPGQSEYDAQRSRDLEQQGLKVLQFDDRQVLLQTETVLETIFQAMKNPS